MVYTGGRGEYKGNRCLSSEKTEGTLQRKGLACKCCAAVVREDMASTSPSTTITA